MNLARRAITGSAYAGWVTSWTDDPSQFAAAHFLRDGLRSSELLARFNDLAASGLHPLWLLRIPAPGLRAEVDLVPFFVRRDERSASRPVMVLVPTATYLSYANSRFWWEEPILSEAVHDRLVELGPDDQYLMLHEELGPSSYDVHDDGTDVTARVGRLRTCSCARPTGGRGFKFPTFLIDWLEHVGADYEVATDADLHAGGARLLDDVTVVITGTHRNTCQSANSMLSLSSRATAVV